jgi:hypothetical protein
VMNWSWGSGRGAAANPKSRAGRIGGADGSGHGPNFNSFGLDQVRPTKRYQFSKKTKRY